jgi:HSP20 family protein
MFTRSSSTRGVPQAQQRGGAIEPRRPGMPSPFGSDGGPFALLRQLDEDMNRLFDEFYRGSGITGGEGGWMPQVEVQQREGKLHVCADLPGMKKDDIKVDLADGQLTIQGERRRESSGGDDAHGGGYYRSERSYGSFYRSIPLPEGIDVDSAEASFRDGVLDISFDAPKEAQTRARRLEITEGSSPGGGASGAGDLPA